MSRDTRLVSVPAGQACPTTGKRLQNVSELQVSLMSAYELLIILKQCFKKHGRAREKPQSRAWHRHSLEYGGWRSHGGAVTSNTHDWLAGLPKSHRYYVGVVLSDNPEVILTIVIRDNTVRSSSTTFPFSLQSSASMSANSYHSCSSSRELVYVFRVIPIHVVFESKKTQQVSTFPIVV